MSNVRYMSVSMPVDLIRQVDTVLGKHGYKSRAEFVKDAVRRMLEQLQS